MPKNNPKSISKENLHWFWRITTKWRFFFLLYLFLVLLFVISIIISEINTTIQQRSIFNLLLRYLGAFVAVLFFMPNGLFYYAHLFGLKVKGEWFYFFPFIFHFGFIISWGFVYYYKYKKNKALKWLIIAIIILLLLSFSGCIIGANVKNSPFKF